MSVGGILCRVEFGVVTAVVQAMFVRDVILPNRERVLAMPRSF
jgi:hypothetical protein